MSPRKHSTTEPAGVIGLPPDPWAIGIYAGAYVTALHPHPRARNPVLPRADVSDVQAAFVADPFMVRVASEWHMFFEVFNAERRQGEIGLAVSRDAIRWRYQQIVLRTEHHLSYPFISQWRGSWFLIPESHESGTISLYSARRFPDEWTLEQVLLPIAAGDATPFFSDETWWMCACSRPREHDELRLYMASDLTGPWREHPRSPIVRRDRNRARPAGRVVRCQGRLLRLCQVCDPRYGMSVRAFEVTRLTATEYEEREHADNPVLQLSGSGWNGRGMHHVDSHLVDAGRWIACVDGHFQPPGWSLTGE